VAAAAGVVLVSAGKALRWQRLYPRDAPAVPASTHFSILLIAQMLNLMVPVRLGEVARMGLMQQEGRPAGVTLGTILVEKSLDLLAVGTLLLLAVPLAALPAWLRPRAGPSALLTALGLLACLLIVRVARGPLVNRISALFLAQPGPLPQGRRRLGRLLGSILDGIAGLDAGRLAPVLLLTVLVWLVSAGAIQAMLKAFGISGEWRIALLLMLALTFANLAPTPPALIGVIGAIAVLVLVPFGIPSEQALALGSLLNAVMVLPVVLLGGAAAGARIGQMLLPGHRGSLRQHLGLAPIARDESERWSGR
jgi:uncharacterized membrane protein YbhN (UPF0104 family)